MLDGVCAAVAYYHRRLALKQRTHQLFNVRAGVLVVGVGVDDDVGAQAQACVDSRHEALCKSAVVHEAYYVVYAQLLCALYGAVGAAVVDDEVFDLVDTVDVPGEVVYGHVEGLGFVIAGYLDYQFHVIVLPFDFVIGTLPQEQFFISSCRSFRSSCGRNTAAVSPGAGTPQVSRLSRAARMDSPLR